MNKPPKFIIIPLKMATNNANKRKSNESNDNTFIGSSSSASSMPRSEKLLKTDSKKDSSSNAKEASHSTDESTSTDVVEVLPTMLERLSKLESELKEVEKELSEFKAYNNKTILAEDAYQMKSFWNRNRSELEDYISKKIAECTKVVRKCTKDMSTCMRKLDVRVTEVWEKEETRTLRLDALIGNEKKKM